MEAELEEEEAMLEGTSDEAEIDEAVVVDRSGDGRGLARAIRLATACGRIDFGS